MEFRDTRQNTNSLWTFTTPEPAPSPTAFPSCSCEPSKAAPWGQGLKERGAQRFPSPFPESKWYYTVLPLFLRAIAKNHMKPRGNAIPQLQESSKYQVAATAAESWSRLTPSQTLAQTLASESCCLLLWESFSNRRTWHFCSRGHYSHTLKEEGGDSSHVRLPWPPPHRKEGGGKGNESKWL